VHRRDAFHDLGRVALLEAHADERSTVPYRFQSDEAVRTAILRCAGEQLDEAMRELTENVDADPVEAVHSARKAIKKERSLLRLARGSMKRGQRRRENVALRDAARGLSTARDAEARLETLNALSKRYIGQLPEATFHQIRERLEHRRDAERSQLIGSPVAGEAADALHAVRSRQPEWRLARGGWEAVELGLWRSYRDGREAFSRARSHPASADWHGWRKRVKDLWYQQRLLTPAGGPVLDGQAKDAHALADVLGDEHDLGVLKATLESEQMTPPVDLDAVIELIGHRRRELRGVAVRLGARIYAESPKRYTRRTRACWEAGRDEQRAVGERDPAEIADAVRGAG
jgi:CHAD domain-containing protein